jgi:hypothetical protein
MVVLKLNQLDSKGSFTLEINKREATKQFNETVAVRLSGQRILLQAHPGTTADSLRLFVAAAAEIVVSELGRANAIV